MHSEREKILELLERRLELVRALNRLAAQWRQAFIAWDLNQSENFAADEERLSMQILALDMEIASHEAPCSPQAPENPAARAPLAAPLGELDRNTDRKIREVLGRMRALHLELKRSNEIRKSILTRSKITMNALRNLFNSHAPTYASPAAHPTGSSRGTICEERV